jgi:hypothetical protein
MTGLTARVEAFSDGVFVFALSCCVILIMWVNHHELMRMVCAVDYPFFFANGFALLSVTFVPFPTAVLARHLATAEAKTAVTLYTWGWLFLTIVRGGLLRPEVHLTTIARIRNAYVAGPIVYVIATGVDSRHSSGLPALWGAARRIVRASGCGDGTLRLLGGQVIA